MLVRGSENLFGLLHRDGMTARSIEEMDEGIAQAAADRGRPMIVLESPEAVQAALAAYEQGPADFPDCLIVAKALRAGCDSVMSFDRRMATLAGVRLL